MSGISSRVSDASINASVGTRAYTEQNYVTDAETVTASIDALDVGVAAQLSAIDVDLAQKTDNVVVSNLVDNGNFADATEWSYSLAAGNVAANELAFTATAQYGSCKQLLDDNCIDGHVYYVVGYVKAGSSSVQLQMYKNVGGSALAVMAHTGGGDYEKLAFLATAASSEVVGIRAIDYRASGWTEITIKNFAIYDLTAAYVVAPAILDFERDLIVNNSGLYFVLSQLIMSISTGKSAIPNIVDKPIYVSVVSDSLNIIFKYNDTQDIRCNIKKTGRNSIMNFDQFYKISNSGRYVSSDITAGTSMSAGGTDWLAPWVVWADGTIDGDETASYSVTGGNHNYNNLPTGRTTAYSFHINGRKVTAFADYADYVDVYWTNKVQASNTKKNDGTGREVLQENYHLHFDGYEFKIDCTIDFLENCHVFTYYGLQAVTTPWNGYAFYHSSVNNAQNDGASNTVSSTKTTDCVTMRKTTDWLDMFIDVNRGLGNRSYNTSNDGAFVSSAKVYMKLITNSDPDASQSYSYKGGYRLYHR